METFKKLTIENTKIKQSWKPMFISFIELYKKNKTYKNNLDSLEEILIQYSQFTNNIYPNKNQIFRAFEFFEVSDCKVVILGQDPYHQPGQAMGLAFSVPDKIKIPPSLKNIYKEIVNDPKCNITIEPTTGNLTHWAKQGVLLLNTALTVEYNKPNIHSKQWKLFTDFVIKWFSENTTQTITFMLWGGNAKKKEKLISITKINKLKHVVLKTNHPSPLSANKGGWFGCGHFGLTNSVIEW